MQQTEKGYRQLVAFQRADNLVATVYQITRNFPDEEQLGLMPQMRRVVYSIPVSIAEGYSQATRQSFSQGVRLACRSLVELEYFVDLTLRLGYITTDMHSKLAQEIAAASRSLNGLLASLKSEAQEEKQTSPGTGRSSGNSNSGSRLAEATTYYALAA